ncbi:hypothetical protein BDW69DRAFT_184941 [Aspergillus filifer]
MATYYDTTLNTLYPPIPQLSFQPGTPDPAPSTSALHPHFQQPSHSESSTYKPPFKPIIIPQITQSHLSQITTPFLRAYTPALHSLSPPLSAKEFVTFIDTLNEVFVANPILQATGIAGEIMSFIPMLEIAGVALETVSEIGSEAGSWIRTRGFLKKMNGNLFRPRGVKVCICGVRDIARVFGVDGVEALRGMMEASAGAHHDIQNQYQGVGQDVDMNLLVRRAAELDLESSGHDDQGQGQGQGQQQQQQQRHRLSPGFVLLDALWDRVAELQTTDLPGVEGSLNRLKRWNAIYAAHADRKQLGKLDRKYCEAREKREKRYREAIKAGYEKEKEIVKIEKKIMDLRNENGGGKGRSEREVQREMNNLTAELGKIRREKDERVREKMMSVDESLRELRRKDIKKALKMKYLVILPLDENDRSSE